MTIHASPFLHAARLRIAWALGSLLLGTSIASAGELTIYTSTEGDNLKDFAERFSKANPDIKVNWVRDSTGVLQARAVAEKDNPRNDVVFAHAATSLLALDKMGLLLPYAPVGVEKLDPRYRDKSDPPHWSGMWGFATAICFNTVEAKKRNLPRPTKWADLTDPVYRGQITMPNPVSSGTGFLNVSGWMQIWGAEKAWSFMDKLHQNMASYSHSGSKPCEQVASGEYVLGISLPWRAATLKTMGAPIDVIVPEEGVGWEMQGVAIMKATRNLPDAKRFVDWAISQPAMEAYARRVEVVAVPVQAPRAENVPADLSAKMIKNDFVWASANQAAILTEWRTRYDGKTEPRKP
ncbi:putative 2-aminoethylphosphonate ABC transporter substrate-binding protein [soil metagenome]